MKKAYIIFIFVGFILFMIAKSYHTTKTVMRNSYYFVIEDIDTTSKGSLVFYNKNEKIHFSAFAVTRFDSILIGDSIAKDSCDKWLKFYRFGEDGRAELFLRMESVELIGRNLFCDEF